MFGTIYAVNVVSNVFASRELLWSLTQRELSTKYRRSFLGWAWSMINPLAMAAIYGFVFGVLFGAAAPTGTNSGLTSFAFFMLCALIPWNFFSMSMSLGMNAISANSGLVKKVAFCRETLVLSNVAHAVVQFVIELAIITVLLTIYGSPLLAYLPFVLFLIVLLAVFSAGIALALSALSIFFRDLTYLWSIITQIWFFITPIVYPPELIEAEVPVWGQNLIRLNPMVHFVSEFRACLYHGDFPDPRKMVLLTLTSMMTLVIGWWIFTRLSRRLPEEV